jgi:biotin carboxyl carrier protein
VISSINVKEGDMVKKGQTLLVLEAMKMESEIAAPVDGKIIRIVVKERSPVQEGDVLMVIENEELKNKPAAKPSRRQATPAPASVEFAAKDNVLRAPIPGSIIDVLVKPGDSVTESSVVLILEAMKMESEIHSNGSGRISKVHVRKGDMVQEGDPLIELEA